MNIKDKVERYPRTELQQNVLKYIDYEGDLALFTCQGHSPLGHTCPLTILGPTVVATGLPQGKGTTENIKAHQSNAMLPEGKGMMGN